EASLHQDLNGDGVIGVPATGAVIEAAGSTSLVNVSNHFFLDNISTGLGPSLKLGGADVVAGQMGGWTPIGAEQTASGYLVAWNMTGVDKYAAWNVDSSGNYLGDAIPYVSGASATLKSLETSLHQDLNGDGTIGVPTTGTVIEAFGSTSLVTVTTHVFLDNISTGLGPSLKLGGADVVAGQMGGWTPIGAEQTASGYLVAWNMTGVDKYAAWNVDSSGNYLGDAIPYVSGASATLKSL